MDGNGQCIKWYRAILPDRRKSGSVYCIVQCITLKFINVHIRKDESQIGSPGSANLGKTKKTIKILTEIRVAMLETNYEGIRILHPVSSKPSQLENQVENGMKMKP